MPSATSARSAMSEMRETKNPFLRKNRHRCIQNALILVASCGSLCECRTECPAYRDGVSAPVARRKPRGFFVMASSEGSPVQLRPAALSPPNEYSFNLSPNRTFRNYTRHIAVPKFPILGQLPSLEPCSSPSSQQQSHSRSLRGENDRTLFAPLI